MRGLPHFRLWPFSLWFKKATPVDQTTEEAGLREELEKAKASVRTQDVDDAFERMETLLIEANGTGSES